jgi:peptide deformylase
MSIRRILQLGDPLLRSISTPIPDVNSASETLQDLSDTLHEFQRAHGFGRGISAVQIGAAQRVIYMEFEGVSYRLVNPEWEWMSDETFKLWDDCFSFPDLMAYVQRSKAVRLNYLDQSGERRVLAATGALSELIQHEMDHLEGILAIDRALPGSLCTREEWLRRYKR